MKSRNYKPLRYTLHKKSKTNAKQLPGFDKLIQAWIEVHQQYLNAFQPEDYETSFPYRERPQVSLLGTAVYFCNGISLQEWLLDKKSKRVGRNDLWLRLKHNGQTHDYFVEAKHDWIGLGKNAIKKLEELVGSATASAKKIQSGSKSQSRIRLALSFATLTFPTRKLSKSDEELKRFIPQIDNFGAENEINCWAAIWVNADSFFKGQKSSGKHTSIGLVMLVKRLNNH